MERAVWLYTWLPAIFAIGTLALVCGLLLLAWIAGAKEENRTLDKWSHED